MKSNGETHSQRPTRGSRTQVMKRSAEQSTVNVDSEYSDYDDDDYYEEEEETPTRSSRKSRRSE